MVIRRTYQTHAEVLHARRSAELRRQQRIRYASRIYLLGERVQFELVEHLIREPGEAVQNAPHRVRSGIGGMTSAPIALRKPGICVRLWCWLDRPVGGAELKYWFRNLPVDHALFGANQVIYTANPVFLWGAVDPLPARIAVIPGEEEAPVPPAGRLKPPAPQPVVVRRRCWRSGRDGNISGLIRVVMTAHRGNRNCALYWAARRIRLLREFHGARLCEPLVCTSR